MMKYEDSQSYGSFSVPPAEVRDTNNGSVIVHNIFTYFTLSLSAPQEHMIEEWCWFSQLDFFV